jgi:D-serine deaminase-like pyridoxal phosphate-dependent protein
MPLSYRQITAAISGRRLPLAFVDLDAFDRNIERVAALVRPRGTPLRVASKSLRSVALLERIRERGGAAFRGVLCYSVEEAEHLAAAGLDDLLVAYPAFQRCDLDRAAALCARGARLALMADSREAVDRIGAAAAANQTTIAVVLCVDMSLRLAGDRLHLGVRRSPLRHPAEVVALARHAAQQEGVRFLGVMGYEAQVAGLGDDNPFQPLLNPMKSWVRRASARELGARRAAIVAALTAAGLAPRLVNGGGTGSLDTTTPETGVTEVTAGSAFFKPHLFDYYKSPHMRALEPACFFALEVTRRPAPDLVTCLGGGYVASGPAGADKVPRPWLPEGLALLPAEMCGEVQTPLSGAAATRLELGDPVVFRHAKAGELAEHFNELLLVADGRVVGSAPTYRGQGKCFL